MPNAIPPSLRGIPAELREAEIILIKAAVARIFGPDAVVRNWGTDPAKLLLHIEARDVREPRESELLGLLYARIDRERIGANFTMRGQRISGREKIAYRQGVVL